MSQYEGYAAEFAAPYDDDAEAGWEFYYDGGRRREHGGVWMSHQFDQGYSDARADDQTRNEGQLGFAGYDS